MLPSESGRRLTLRVNAIRSAPQLSPEEQDRRLVRKRLLRYITSTHLRREAERGLAPAGGIRR